MPTELLSLACIELARLETEHTEAIKAFAESRAEPLARIDALRSLLIAYDEPAVTISKPDKVQLSESVKSITEEKPLSEIAEVGGLPSQDRPALTNFQMIEQALLANDGAMTASEIVKWIVANIWAGCPASFSGSPYGLVGSGKLHRSGQKFVLAQKKAAPGQAAPPAPKPPPSTEIITHPQHRPKPPPPPQPKQFASADGKRSFEYGGTEVILPVKWWRLVNKLLTAMGKGYLPATTVVVAAFGTERMPVMPQEWLASERFGINEALEPTQLMMVIEKAGVFLKRRDA